MKTATELAERINDMYQGENWSGLNLKDLLADITYSEAITLTKVSNYNVASIVAHMIYYFKSVATNIESDNVDINEEKGFKLKNMEGDVDWQELLRALGLSITNLVNTVNDIDASEHIESAQIDRNLHVAIEHSYYHLGQILFLKRLLRSAIP